MEIETIPLKDDGAFPNNANLPLVFMKNAFEPGAGNLVERIEDAFHGNGWVHSWRNGLYPFHHYHSTAHEALGLYSGWVKAQLGGPDGSIVVAKAGDVIVVPAGVAHKNLDQSSDFRVVGAYPQRQFPDMQYGKPGERPKADDNIKKVALPKTDPVSGRTGPLIELWKSF